MDYETLTTEFKEGVGHLTLNQPEIGNSFNQAFCAEFGRVANEIAANKDVRSVLLRANGKFFSVGGDVKMFSKTLDTLPEQTLEWVSGLHLGMARLARIDAPIVAAVHGTAVGGAVGLLAGCDLVYCGRSASLGAAYIKLGYTCDMGATYTLASRMGISRARRFLILGEVLTADEALQAGLVDHVVDDAAVIVEAEKAAIRLANGPTRAYGELRRLFIRALGQPFDALLEDEAMALIRAVSTKDAHEGIMAFVERRPAKFKGR